VEEMLVEGGLDLSYETVRRWFLKFGSAIAANLRRTRPKPSDHWHLDEMGIVIRSRRYWLWRAVDNEGEILDFLVQRKRDAKAAKKLMKKLLRKHGFAPSRIVTEMLRSYSSAFRATGLAAEHDRSLRADNRAENSHQPLRRREDAMARFRDIKTLQKFAAVHASIHNHFNQDRHLIRRNIFKQNRSAAMAEWRQLAA
jgi:transposase-like protein